MAKSASRSPGVVEQIPSAGHVCLIYEDDEQRRRTVAEFIAAGLREGEAVRYFADATPPDTVRAWLEEAGIPIAAAEARGAFAIAPAVSAYCVGGSHDPQALIDGLASRYEAADRAGYTGSRSAGEMSWVMKGCPDPIASSSTRRCSTGSTRRTGTPGCASTMRASSTAPPSSRCSRSTR